MSSDEKTLEETHIDEIVEIPQYGKKNVILDATLLTSIMNCPRLTDFRFNHNFHSIEGKGNSLECGQIVHKFLEVFYKGIINGLKRESAVGFAFSAAEMYIQGCKHCTDFVPTYCEHYITSASKDWIDCVENAKAHLQVCTICVSRPTCGHKPNDYPGVQNTPKESSTKPDRVGWHWVLDTCQQYIDHYRNDHWVPLEVEIVKGKVLYEDDEIRILWKAKLDLTSDTNQGIFPVDHKTMKQRRETISMNNQFMGQCLIMETQKVFINKIGFQTTLKPAEKFERPPINYSVSRLIEWQSETLPFYAKLLLMYAETGMFPPNFTNCESKYGKCAFLKVCQSDPAMREEEIKKLFIVGPKWDPTNDED